MRDDFSKKTKRLLAKRVGTICSNPGCSVPTYGPNHNPYKATSKGVAAHLTAASPEGPRYASSLSTKERKDYHNGIWLCQSCARMIDVDENEYTLSVLRSWKEKAESRARRALNNPAIVNTGPNFAETIAIVIVQREQLTIEPPPSLDIPPGYIPRQTVNLEPVDVPNDLRDVQFAIQYGPMREIPDGHFIVTTICQNQGTGIDKNVKVDIEFDSDAIVNHHIFDTDRIQRLNGGNKGSWSASFAIQNLLPGEYQGITVGAREEPFQVNIWSQNSTRQVSVFRFDAKFGDWEVVPKSESPQNGR